MTRGKTSARHASWIFFRKTNILSAFFVSCRIFWEFFLGFLFISKFDKSVSFFGSARETLPDSYYADSEELAGRLSRKGFAVITGGGGGIMESANRGSFRAHGDSVGILINLPEERAMNSFLNHKRQCRRFPSRKTFLSCGSEIYIFFPGGFGTLDELFEMLVLAQTKREMVPIILFGKSFWCPLITFIEDKLIEKYKTVSPAEGRTLFRIVDSVDEAEHYIDSTDIHTRTCKVDFGEL